MIISCCVLPLMMGLKAFLLIEGMRVIQLCGCGKAGSSSQSWKISCLVILLNSRVIYLSNIVFMTYTVLD